MFFILLAIHAKEKILIYRFRWSVQDQTFMSRTVRFVTRLDSVMAHLFSSNNSNNVNRFKYTYCIFIVKKERTYTRTVQPLMSAIYFNFLTNLTLNLTSLAFVLTFADFLLKNAQKIFFSSYFESFKLTKLFLLQFFMHMQSFFLTTVLMFGFSQFMYVNFPSKCRTL